ncbi:LuxR family transcriptional regulator [Streptomyces sp. NPDC026672]|uniref:LuxR family transcriptional regulator n=1 Tax=unclassified Streptomyces TaxID=2593676 RepID=UPI0033D1C734
MPDQEPHSHELALLEEELEYAHISAICVRLTGEPLIGKTSLALRLTRSAAHRGWTVAYGRAARDDAHRPYSALVDALDDCVAAAGPAVLEPLGPARRRLLGQVFPSLGAPHGHPREDLDVPAVNRAVRALLERLAGDHGLLVVLDDAHRAGGETAELAEHLVHRPPQAPVLTLLVHRTGGPTARRLGALSRPNCAVRHVPLRPLHRQAAETLLPADLTPLSRELILRDGAGVPGLLRALSDRAPRGSRTVPHSSLELSWGPSPLPPSVQALDLGSLSARAQCAADAAAVTGDPFTPEEVAHTAGMTVEETLHAVDELHHEGIIRLDGCLAEHFRFSHPAVRALLYQTVGTAHRRAARERVLALGPGTGTARPDSAAANGAVSVLLERAAPPTAVEADVLERSAHSLMFTQPARAAWAASRAAQRPGSTVRARLLLGQALVLCGRPAEALAEYARLWQAAGPLPAGSPMWPEAAVWRARALRLLGDPEQARRVLRTAGADEPSAFPAAQAELAALLLESDAARCGAALVAARRAVQRIPTRDVAARGHALAVLAAVHAANGDAAAARDVVAEAKPLLSGLGREGAAPVVEAWRWLGAAGGGGGHVQGILENGFALALYHGQGHVLGPLALGLARVCLDSGDRKAAAGHAAFAVEEFDRLAAHASATAARELLESSSASIPDERVEILTTELSRREKEIATLIGPGLTNKEIAARLDISTKTVETYMARIFKKLGVKSRAEVVFRLSVSPSGQGVSAMPAQQKRILPPFPAGTAAPGAE